MIGKYGDIVFETTDTRILNFKDLKISKSNRTTSHNILMKKPILEFLGPELDSITFTVNLNASLGINVTEERNKWYKNIENATADELLIGNKKIGQNKWLTTSINETYNTILNNGQVYSLTLEITLQEYVENFEIVINQIEKKDIEIYVPSPPSNLINRDGIVTAKIGLRIRNGPGLDYERIGVKPKGERVFVILEENGWYKIGEGEYMCATYIKLV